jgi:hypothetical protein
MMPIGRLVTEAGDDQGRWCRWGASLPGPVSSAEVLEAEHQHLVAGQEWPRGMRFSVVQGGRPPAGAAAPGIATNLGYNRCVLA